jgi:uncharacterized phage protein (TIGR01671 family)
MREFKFRAWNEWDEGNEMVYFTILQPRLIDDLHPNAKTMQFTGLKDKNDVDIYEGDIVLALCSCSGRNKHSAKLHKCEVQWSSLGMPGYDLLILDYKPGEKWHTSYLEIGQNGDAFEVIGNIYENPELLK